MTQPTAQPEVVTREQWQSARDELLVREKEATRALDVLAAQRRRLPMVRFDGDYVFDSPDGKAGLLDLFDGRQESWETSPEGWPQTPPYAWWRRHDEY